MLLLNYESPNGKKLHKRLWNGGNGYGEIKLMKKDGTPKNKKNKRKIGEIFIDENKQYNKNINIISSPIHKFIITKGDYNESRKKNNLELLMIKMVINI